MVFHKLAIGSKFRSAKVNGSGISSNTVMWLEYQKVSKSEAITTAQYGYGNTRQVGYKKRFSPNSPIYVD